jgi:hypothetical protein
MVVCSAEEVECRARSYECLWRRGQRLFLSFSSLSIANIATPQPIKMSDIKDIEMGEDAVTNPENAVEEEEEDESEKGLIRVVCFHLHLQ